MVGRSNTTIHFIQLLVLLCVTTILSSPLFATAIRLETEQKTVSAGELLSLSLIISEDSDDAIREVQEPPLPGFEIENRGESSSQSFNMINGRVSYKRERTISYELRPSKNGTFTLGPAGATLKSGKKIQSNTVQILVTGASGGSTQQPSQGGTLPGSGNTPQQTETQDLFAPLNEWEKSTGRAFIRVVTSPSKDIYRGEPVIVSYWLFMQKGAISDIAREQMPTFENSWSEVLDAPRSLSFQRMNIDNVIWDYALLKRYVLVPDAKNKALTATQLILDVVTGSFIDARKKSLSSMALNLPLTDLPQGSDGKPAGAYGSFELSQDKTALSLKSDKQLDTVSYTVEGCGNFQQVTLTLPDTAGLKIFAPDINETHALQNDQFCGKKTFKFMVKGLRNGSFELPALTLTAFDKVKGFQTLTSKPVAVTVQDITQAEAASDKAPKQISFELLRELPKDLAVYNLTPLTLRPLFRILLTIPLAATLLAILIYAFSGLVAKRRKGENFKAKLWEERMHSAPDTAALLNVLYDALSDTCAISLKGERSRISEKRYEKIAFMLDFLRDLQHYTYAGNNDGELVSLKAKAVEYFRKVRESA